jgi:hypothetical protein
VEDQSARNANNQWNLKVISAPKRMGISIKPTNH